MNDTVSTTNTNEPLARASGLVDETVLTNPWSVARRVRLLALLCVVNAASLMDRQLVSILIVPIKKEFGASDMQMGLLTGLAFAAVYVVAGFPLAIWADNGHRRTVLTVALGLWSTMTMLCGMTYSFVQLAATRMGVALGEAGCNPVSHSLIADLFSMRGRARAIGFYNASGSIGVGLGILAGATLVSYFDWRIVFVIVGAPGLLLALVVRFTMREPVRGLADARRVGGANKLTLRERLFQLARVRTLRDLSLAATACGFINYGFVVWAPAFFMRVHGLAASDVGAKLAPASMIGMLIGTIGAGVLADHGSRTDLRWPMRIAGGAMAAAWPCGALCLLTANVNLAFVAYGFTTCLLAAWSTPVYALTQTVAPARMRGLASAVMAFCVNAAGYGLGPVVVGALSDRLAPALGIQSLRYALFALLAASVGVAWLCVATNRHVLADSSHFLSDDKS